MTDPLHEYDEAVLREIARPTRGTDQIGEFRPKSDLEEEFGKDSHRLKQAIETLQKRNYIKDIEAILMAIGDKSVGYDAYQITALGRNYLIKSNTNTTSFKNIHNSNIAHQSTNVRQSIKISDLPKDIQEKIHEFDQAAQRKDPSGMKKAFGYIADKAVDVAIALGTGALMR